MTRPLHAETNVQRGDHPSDEQRARGYEPRDASPGKVVLGVACFLALMLVGLAFAAATLGWLQARDKRPRDLAPVMAVSPPPPHLFAEPEAARRRHDAAMEQRLKDASLDRARRDLVQRGWGEAEATPSTPAVARQHREAAQ